jgi:hypothetical protein
VSNHATTVNLITFKEKKTGPWAGHVDKLLNGNVKVAPLESSLTSSMPSDPGGPTQALLRVPLQRCIRLPLG